MGWAHGVGIKALADAGLVEASITAVCDLDGDRAASLAAATGAATAERAAEVAERCDAVWVCTPTAFHGDAVEEAAARERAGVCVKPLATGLAGAEEMGAVLARAGVAGQVGLVLRYSPACRALHDLVASGRLGPVMTVVLRDDQYFPVKGLYGSTWRADVALAGGGCLIEHSIHDVDILRLWLGEVSEVSAVTGNFAGHAGVEDLATASMRFTSGATAELVSVWHDVLSRGSNRRVELFCRDGVAWLDDEFRGPVHVQTSDGVEVVACRYPSWVDGLSLGSGDGLGIAAYVEEDRAFLDAVAAGRPPSPGFEEAVAAHRIVDAMYRSAQAGAVPVTLHPARPGQP